VKVTALLCDSAQVAPDGKLYILGGGWAISWAPDQPLKMSLAILVAVPWNRANQRLNLEINLLTGDNEPVFSASGDEQPVRAEGELEMGRPPGTRSGSDLNACIAVPFDGLVLPASDYVWTIQINNEEEARIPFRVDNPPMTG